MAITLEELQAEAVRFRDDRDWKQFHTLKNLAMGLGIEVGELSELLLWKEEAQVRRDLLGPRFRERMADELADVMIFLLYLAESSGVVLSDAVRAKLRKNAQKYPVEKARGTARKYNEL